MEWWGNGGCGEWREATHSRNTNFPGFFIDLKLIELNCVYMSSISGLFYFGVPKNTHKIIVWFFLKGTVWASFQLPEVQISDFLWGMSKLCCTKCWPFDVNRNAVSSAKEVRLISPGADFTQSTSTALPNLCHWQHPFSLHETVLSSVAGPGHGLWWCGHRLLFT